MRKRIRYGLNRVLQSKYLFFIFLFMFFTSSFFIIYNINNTYAYFDITYRDDGMIELYAEDLSKCYKKNFEDISFS